MSKISEEDSCPAGWKIWSPRSKSDWTAVYEALGHNIHKYPRRPHLIIDITRNKVGCGGCTKFAMNSKVGQQHSWRTSDGSPWWLRDTKYNEPNGDYAANCYMQVYDVNPNNVRFNDANCGQSSTDYLCQPKAPPPAHPGLVAMLRCFQMFVVSSSIDICVRITYHTAPRNASAEMLPGKPRQLQSAKNHSQKVRSWGADQSQQWIQGIQEQSTRFVSQGLESVVSAQQVRLDCCVQCTGQKH